MSRRTAVTADVEPVETPAQQIEHLEASRLDLLRERARNAPGADARLDELEREIEHLKRQPSRDREQADVLTLDAAERARLDAEAARQAKITEEVRLTVEWRAQAVQIEADMAAGIVRLDRLAAMLASARDVYALHVTIYNREHRSARAAGERTGEWIAGKLGLAIPWSVPRERRALSLTQLLGLDGGKP